MRLAEEVTSALERAIKSWDAGDQAAARVSLDEAVKLAETERYL
jgi:hypothetical protein